MEAPKLFVTGVVLMGAFVSVNALQCYECMECPDSTITESHLVTCGEDTTTTINVESTVSGTTPVETTVASTAAPVETTVAPTAVPVETTVAPTAVPVDTTVAPTAVPVETTVAPTTVPVETTVAPTAVPVETTVAPTAVPVETTVAPTAVPVETTVAPTAVPVETTVAPTAVPVETTFAPTAVPVETTVAPTAVPVETTVAPTAAPVETSMANTESNPAEPNAMRLRRHILPETVNLDNRCRCNGEKCACVDETQEAEVKRVFSYTDAVNTSYVCGRVVTEVNGTEVVSRGCAPTSIDNVEFCTYMMANNVTSCSTCNTDKCNNSGLSLQHSVTILLFVLTMGLFTD